MSPFIRAILAEIMRRAKGATGKMTAEEIKHLRLSAGLSQEEFARELDISFATVNRWENNRASPSRLAQKLLLKFKKRTKRLHAS